MEENRLLETAFQMLLQASPDMIFVKDSNLVYRAASMSFITMVGKTSAEEVVGHTDNEIFMDSQLAKRYVLDDRKILETQKDLLSFVEPIPDVDGQARYGSTTKCLIRNEKGESIGILGITKDITLEYFARQRYQQELRYLFGLPEDTYAVCYIDVDDWRVIKQKRKKIEGGTLQECQTVEETCRYAVESIVNQKNPAVEFYSNFEPAKLWKIYTNGRSNLSFEYERKLSDGSTRWVHNEVHFLSDVDSGHLCVMLSARDINESKLEEQKIIDAAKLDQMTKVFNRETAMEYIRRNLKNESDRQHALFMLDIDNFKALNDTLGHQEGDDFLIRLAGQLKDAFRDSDVVGRIGGDEFFIFLRNIPEIKQIERRAADVLKVVSSLAKGYLNLELSGSVGISLYPEHGKTLEDLYAKADEALYIAKNSGKNRYVFAE